MEEIELLDIADDLLIINKTTIERLFQEENTDVIVLYMFYYKTAKWQKYNPIKASDEYSSKCLHWGLHRVKNIKRRLKEMELINVEKRKNDKKQIDGWYIRINYYIDKNSSGSISSGSLSPLVVKQTHKILNNNNINTNNNKDTNKKKYIKEKYGNYGRVTLTKDEYFRLVEEYGEEFITKQIELLDEYVESNNNKNKYSNFNLVLRKSIRENWFSKPSKGSNFLDVMKKERDKYD